MSTRTYELNAVNRGLVRNQQKPCTAACTAVLYVNVESGGS